MTQENERLLTEGESDGLDALSIMQAQDAKTLARLAQCAPKEALLTSFEIITTLDEPCVKSDDPRLVLWCALCKAQLAKVWPIAEARIEQEREKALKEARALFLKYLTTDSEVKDARRKDFNQAIFNADWGWAVFNDTNLYTVMEKFDKAARETK